MNKQIHKLKSLKFIIWAFAFLFFWFVFSVSAQNTTSASSIYNSIFFQNLNQLNIPIGNLLLRPTLTRYDFTRLLNAVECQDCVVPTEDMARLYNQSFWATFRVKPWKYFSDVWYLSGTYNGTNYYYCVAKVWNNDVMNWYPLGSSSCWGQFCGQWNVSKAEFFQTLSNLLMDRQMFNYAAPWKDIKEWFSKLKPTDYRYKYFNANQIAVIQSKEKETQSITNRTEYTTYLGYCTFNPENCWFQTFPSLGKNVWPLAEVNALIRAWIISADDVTALNSPISPMDAVEKIELVYELHTKCEFDNDYDCDWIPNHEDNCPYNYNPTQSNLDWDNLGDVCDDDIDWDKVKNPVGLVDDNWRINYGLLKNYPSQDTTPLWDQVDDAAYFIEVSSLDQKFPSFVQFQIIGPEAPASVEWDFWDLWSAKGKSVSHTYSNQGTYTVSAKVTTQSRREYIISTQVFFWNTTDTSYNLNIDSASIDNNKKTGAFQIAYQWKFDYLQWENSAIWIPEKLRPWANFLTPLIANERNNITVKGYVNNILMAVATVDVLDDDWKFYTFTPTYSPLIKKINSRISTTLKLVNIPTSSIDRISWTYDKSTSFFDSRLVTYNTYTEQGKKVLKQTIKLKNGNELISTSTLNIQDPSVVWNQTYNIIPETSNYVNLRFKTLWLSLSENDSLSTTLNWQPGYSEKNVKDDNIILSLWDRQGVVKVNTKYSRWSLSLENKGIISFWTKNQTWLKLWNINALFSGLKCDLDKDWIPDLYDDDIDWDGVPNLLGMIQYEKSDCSLIVWDNVDELLYKRHIWVCSLDNCPFRANANQADLNANGIWDICENEGNCWDWKIDPGEDCASCPQDVGQCTAFCWNGIKEEAENCKNCPADMPTCPSLCWNSKTDTWEECDLWPSNWNWECTIACTRYKTPNCWNGKIDAWETCVTCPMDVWDICIQPGITSCWDWKIDPGENCDNCPQDVGECSATCPNGIREEWENCLNCPKDMPYCPSLCWNEQIDKWEDCDAWTRNWKNNECWFDCKFMKKPVCWNGIIEDGETCLTCEKDVWSCSATCPNNIQEKGETCENCPKDVKKCPSLCWNEKIDSGETCDHGPNNGKDWSCTITCTGFDINNPTCWNGIIDKWETCQTCAIDLKDICIDTWSIVTCWNGIIDPWETCLTCEKDVWSCSATCPNNIQEKGETCENCPKDMNQCPTLCWNEKIDSGETCDHGPNNGKDWSCTITCTGFDINNPTCWNGIIDKWETCQTCATDLKDICIDTWTVVTCWNGIVDPWETCETCPRDLKDICLAPWEWKCWNGILEEGETCLNCPTDAWSCNWLCWNGKIESSETCQNCPQDVGQCSWSCWNGIQEPWEGCDNGSNNNWKDWLCSKDCKVVDPDQICWNWDREWTEVCDGGSKNWTPWYSCTLSCTGYLPDFPKCWNKEIDPWETCETCAIDLWDKCLQTCWNGKQEIWETCDNWYENNGKDWICGFDCHTPADPKIYCWNGTKEKSNGEECDKGSGKNGVDWSSCDANCKDVVKKPKCWNGELETWEDCDLWKSRNWNVWENCSTNCTWIRKCPNGQIDQWENCNTCPEDSKDACIIPWKGECWNWIIEDGETCETCPQDVGQCTAYCWNGKVEDAETCSSCPKDVMNCRGSCWNGTLEPWEECDHWDKNWKDGKCNEQCINVDSQHFCWNWKPDEWEMCDDWVDNGTSRSSCTLKCTEYNFLKPLCWNWKIDLWENCVTCPVDLWIKCSNTCWNWEKEYWEDCDSGNFNGKDWICSAECKTISKPSTCWNNKVDANETCYNCPEDLKACSWSCWNWEQEPWEECDNWSSNWTDWQCSKDCRNISKSHYCWDWTQDKNEACDDWENNWTSKSDCTKSCTRKDPKYPGCWNWKVDNGENCTTCATDLWVSCLASCWNGIQETNEACDNWDDNWTDWICSKECSFEHWAVCWNGVIEWDEKCDLWKEKNGSYGVNCTSLCWEEDECPNWKIDENENCQKCSADLWAICITSWSVVPICWNGIIEAWEDCKNCKEDVWECNAFCWNHTIEKAEHCSTCSEDVKACRGSCWNKILEAWEQCDYWTLENGFNWICTTDCRLIWWNDKCWNGEPDQGEQCDAWDKNWTTASNCTLMCTILDATHPKCWNGVYDVWEDCESCPVDLGSKCSYTCWNGIPETWEECDDWVENNWFNGKCSFSCKRTTAKCWNGIQEWDEKCDKKDDNWKEGSWCTKDCRLERKPSCWDGVWDKEAWEECDLKTDNWKEGSICWKDCKKTTNCNDWDTTWETCQTCAEDVWERCFWDDFCWDGIHNKETEKCDDWTFNWLNNNCKIDCTLVSECPNWKIDGDETCKSCESDVKKCSAECWNGIIEPAENCSNCKEDVGACVSSCGDWIREWWEQCDYGSWNWINGICTKNCKMVVTPWKPYCWDGHTDIDRWEQCDAWEDNWKGPCSFICTTILPWALCGNGKIDAWETCATCPIDLWTKCATKCWDENLDEPREQCDRWERNGRDWECTLECKNVVKTVCWNGIPEWDEACDHGPNNWKDNECTESCTIFDPNHPNCWNKKVDPDEDCSNCDTDVWLCTWSCWNKKVEDGEECDNWTGNWVDWLCDINCRNIDPNNKCWNGLPDPWETCDQWTANGVLWQCTIHCKTVVRPKCWNGKIDNDVNENCNTCPEDLWVKCLTKCWNGKPEKGEQCDYGTWNGVNGICTEICTDVESCWNGERDENEDCDTCAEDVADKCVNHWEKCWDGNKNTWEQCINCSEDVWKCSASCWNGIKEDPEQCDYGTWNGVNGICNEQCVLIGWDHFCWDWHQDSDEECDHWDINHWNGNGNDHECRIDCKRFTDEQPDCWDWKEQPDEQCDNCSVDLWNKCQAVCWDWIVSSPIEDCDPNDPNMPEGVVCVLCKIQTKCWNHQQDPGEDCENCPWDVPICDEDCDCVPDSLDECKDLPGKEWPEACKELNCTADPDDNWCPPLPDVLCEWDGCALVKPVCNSCPCQFADYSNTLQKDDSVRARLWDMNYKVHYSYSEFVPLGTLFSL